MEKRPLRYHSFILTLWEETAPAADRERVWRIRLEDPYTSERFGFTNLTQLIEFLNQWANNLPFNEEPLEI